MKKLLLILTFILLPLIMPMIIWADAPSWLSNITFQTGYGYAVKTHQSVGTLTIKALDFDKPVNPNSKLQTILAKFDPAINVGYATTDKVIVGLSVSLLKLSDYMSTPILNLVVFEPMASYSFGRLNFSNVAETKNDWIFGVKIIEKRF